MAIHRTGDVRAINKVMLERFAVMISNKESEETGEDATRWYIVNLKSLNGSVMDEVDE